MEKITKPLTKKQIVLLRRRYGRYVKVTVDIVKRVIVVGCELHADGAALLEKDGSVSENLWGGGINWQTKQVDASAVFNLKPRLGNNSMEILDPEIRRKFVEIVESYLLPNKRRER